MKKISLLLAVLTAIALLVSCSGNKEEAFEEALGATDSTDWSGHHFEILQTSGIDDKPLYYLRDTNLADNALQRIKDVEKSHSCEIALKYIGSDTTFKTLLSASLAIGDALADIIFTDPAQIREYGNLGGLVNIEYVSDYINIYDESKWGAPNVWEFLMCNGTMCGVVPVSWMNMGPAIFYPIVFNSDITGTFGYYDLREIYEQGEWTREKMMEVAVDCTDNTRSTPIKGLAACLKHFIRSALLNNGTSFAEFNDDVSEYYCGWTTEAGIEALEWVKFVIDNYDENMYKFTDTDFGDWNYTNTFMNGEAAMLLTSSGEIFDKIAYKVDNFGLLPFPAGPYGDPTKYVGFYEKAETLSIPIYAKEIECSAILIDEIFSPLEQYPDAASIENYYETNVFSDARDYKILIEMSKNCKYSFWPDGGDAVLNSLYSNLAKMSPVEVLESYGSASDKCIIEQMIPSIFTVRRLSGDESYK
ncbi:MAG: extracellular solute-binding protein [Clostridia bacterium]|nr:extracellular solute-binding protein [Clostridia bacterium]